MRPCSRQPEFRAFNCSLLSLNRCLVHADCGFLPRGPLGAAVLAVPARVSFHECSCFGFVREACLRSFGALSIHSGECHSQSGLITVFGLTPLPKAESRLIRIVASAQGTLRRVGGACAASPRDCSGSPTWDTPSCSLWYVRALSRHSSPCACMSGLTQPFRCTPVGFVLAVMHVRQIVLHDET